MSDAYIGSGKHGFASLVDGVCASVTSNMKLFMFVFVFSAIFLAVYGAVALHAPDPSKYVI